jgi:hypothetical protein
VTLYSSVRHFGQGVFQLGIEKIMRVENIAVTTVFAMH